MKRRTICVWICTGVREFVYVIRSMLSVWIGRICQGLPIDNNGNALDPISNITFSFEFEQMRNWSERDDDVDLTIRIAKRKKNFFLIFLKKFRCASVKHSIYIVCSSLRWRNLNGKTIIWIPRYAAASITFFLLYLCIQNTRKCQRK